MKKTLTSIATFLLLSVVGISARAQNFEVPAPTFTVPLNGDAELLYNMFQVTWGYYGIVDNMGDEPMTCTLTMPDGTIKTVKGTISDANMEGTIEGKAPAITDNALSFRNFMDIDDHTMQLIQQYGTYLVNIPEATVLVNGVPNPEANLQFTVTGIKEVTYMPQAEIIYPTSEYLSYIDSMRMYWPNQEIYFVDDVESISLKADLDGNPLVCNASIHRVMEIKEDGSGIYYIDILYISFDDFLSYTNGTYLTVTIPEGIIANAEGEVNRAQTVEITLLPQIEGELIPASNSELESEEAFVKVKWEGISVQPLQGSTIVARYVATGTDNYVKVIFDSENSILIDLTSLPVGKYEILIPEAYLLVLTEQGLLSDSYAINTEMYATYTITDNASSGIEKINSGSDYRVYSIDGKNILNTSKYSEVENLPKGIYIINGRKVEIRTR